MVQVVDVWGREGGGIRNEHDLDPQFLQRVDTDVLVLALVTVERRHVRRKLCFSGEVIHEIFKHTVQSMTVERKQDASQAICRSCPAL